MPREEVLSERLLINQKGAVRHFQVRIPDSAERIIGIECGVRMTSAIPTLQQPSGFSESLVYFPVRTMGEIVLQNIGRGNIFFSVPVIEQDAHTGFADFSHQPGFAPKCYSHCGKREVMDVDIAKSSSLVFGMYKDILGMQLNSNLEYWLTIHLWYRTGEEVS